MAEEASAAQFPGQISDFVPRRSPRPRPIVSPTHTGWRFVLSNPAHSATSSLALRARLHRPAPVPERAVAIPPHPALVPARTWLYTSFRPGNSRPSSPRHPTVSDDSARSARGSALCFVAFLVGVVFGWWGVVGVGANLGSCSDPGVAVGSYIEGARQQRDRPAKTYGRVVTAPHAARHAAGSGPVNSHTRGARRDHGDAARISPRRAQPPHQAHSSGPPPRARFVHPKHNPLPLLHKTRV